MFNNRARLERKRKENSMCFSSCYRIKNNIRSVQYCFTIHLSPWFMYCHAVRHKVVGFGDERDIFSVLYCSGTKAMREAIQNEAGSCDDLDCTNVFQ